MLRIGGGLLLVVVALLAILFMANGVSSRWRTPELGTTGTPAKAGPVRSLRVMAFNVAKCGFHQGGFRFAEPTEVRERLDRIAETIVAADVDLVFLSEIVAEAAPCPVDQVAYLAEKAGFHAFAFGENYSWGIPFLRIRAGNALLSRHPLRPVENVQLSGRKPFWEPTNNRRLLWCEVELDGEWLLAGSVRNDSFDANVNLLQALEILMWLDRRPALLAGDFNAEPDDESMRHFRDSGLFTDTFDGPPTYPTSGPHRRIDYVLAPRGWTVIEHRVVPCEESDHLPVLAEFRVDRDS